MAPRGLSTTLKVIVNNSKMHNDTGLGRSNFNVQGKSLLLVYNSIFTDNFGLGKGGILNADTETSEI